MRRTLLLVLAAVPVLGLCFPVAARAQAPSFLGKAQSRWVEELRDAKPEVRRAAAFALGKLGEDAFSALPKLRPVLNSDKDAGVRESAATAIGDIVAALKNSAALKDSGPQNIDASSPYWRDVGEALVKALNNDQEAKVRRAAAYALGAFGNEAKEASASLQKALKHKDAGVRQNAAWALGRIGAAVDESAAEDLCELLTDKGALVRRDAAAALGLIGQPQARGGVKPLLNLVQNEQDDVVRKSALEALAHLVGPEDRNSAKILYPLLESTDPELKLGAAFVLSNMGGREAVKALPILRDTLNEDKDPQMQAKAAVALSNIGPDAAPAVPDLTNALDATRDPQVRRNSALALGKIGEAASAAATALGGCLRLSEPVGLRQDAAEALAHLDHPANAKAVPALVEAIRKDTDPLVRQRCVWALFHLPDLKTAGAQQALVELLDDTAPSLKLARYDAARALAAKLEDKAPDKVADVLLDMLHNKDLLVFRSTDAKASGAGSESSSGTKTKANIGGDARYMAAEALGRLGKKAKARQDVVDALKKATRDDDAMLKEKATKALKQIGAD
jgi:HEAT repeat protein